MKKWAIALLALAALFAAVACGGDDDDNKDAAELRRPSIVRPAERSKDALAKDRTKTTADGEPVHSFRSMLDDMATLTKNLVRMPGSAQGEFYMLTKPTPLQARTLDLMGVTLSA